MEIEIFECRYKKIFRLTDRVIAQLPVKITLATTIQYISSLPKIAAQLRKHKIKVDYLKANNTEHKAQVLGCSEFDFKGVKNVLYIGDGRFHPINIKMQFNGKVLAYNPLTEKLTEVTNSEIKKYKNWIRANQIRFTNAKIVGVIISTKPGQRWKAFDKLTQTYKDKKFYFFVFDTVDLQQLLNFSFIEVFVNTACPRLGLEDASQHRLPIINIGSLKPKI